MSIREEYAEVIRMRIEVLDKMLARLSGEPVVAVARPARKFGLGDEVRATARFAATMQRSRRCRVNYTKRCGVVMSCNDSDVLVQWEGTKYVDKVPVAAVERV